MLLGERRILIGGIGRLMGGWGLVVESESHFVRVARGLLEAFWSLLLELRVAQGQESDVRQPEAVRSAWRPMFVRLRKLEWQLSRPITTKASFAGCRS